MNHRGRSDLQDSFRVRYRNHHTQDPDHAFGFPVSGEPLLETGATGRCHIPTDESLGRAWTASDFDDADWASGASGMGFGLQVAGLTVLDVRSSSQLWTLSAADAAIASANAQNSKSEIRQVANLLDSGGSGRFGNDETFPNGGGDDFTTQVSGTIIVPSAGMWTFGMNSDDGGRIRIDGKDVMVDDTLHGPEDHFGSTNLTAGSHTLEAIFFERGGGAHMEVFAAKGSFSSWNSNFKLIGDTEAGGVAAFTTPDGASGGDGLVKTDIQARLQGANPGVYLRFPLTIPDAIDSLSLSMRYNDGFVAYLNGSKVASANAIEDPSWDSTSATTRPSSDTLARQSFNLPEHIGLLTSGTENVLAIHGLNASRNDSSFLILPELEGGQLAPGTPFYFDEATPGALNAEPVSVGKVADTKFDVDRGFYDEPFQVAIVTETEGATIRYTTDGSEPTETKGTVYEGPITISETTVLRVAAFKTGYDPTNIDTQTYLFLDDVLEQGSSAPPGWPSSSVNGQVFDYGLDRSVVNHSNPTIGGRQPILDALTSVPTLSIVTEQSHLTGPNGIYTNPGGRGLAWERESSIEMIFPPGYVSPDGNEEGFQSPCGLRIRGGFSRRTQNPKHSFRLFFRAKYGNGKLNYPLFGDEGADAFDAIDLRGPQNYS